MKIAPPASAFVGRTRELDALARLLTGAAPPPARLVTLTGPGGIGKTRLAHAIGADARVHGAFPDGQVWVDLAPLADDGLVGPAVAEALGVRDRSEREALDAAVGALRNRRTLLILDNCENVLAGCTAFVADLLACHDATVLATSRAPLQVPGEHAWALKGLALPSAPSRSGSERSALLEAEAVRLFVDRATATRHDFALTDETLLAIAEVCRRVDGMPLAIELAAARTRVLSIAELLVRLDAPLSILVRHGGAGPARHATLRATIDGSHGPLEPRQQIAFRRLAVFAGGWTLGAAEAVLADPPGSPEPALATGDVLDVLDHLTRLSLVAVDEREDGPRFRLLEPVRDYAREKLRADDDEERVASRHAAYYLALARETAIALFGREPGAWRRRLRGEVANLRAALLWMADHGDADAALNGYAALQRFWHWSGRCGEALALGTRLVERAPTAADAARAAALLCTGNMAYYMAEDARATDMLGQALDAAQAASDHARAASALLSLGKVAFEYRRDLSAAERHLSEGLALVAAHGPARVPVGPNLLCALGHLQRLQGRYADAQRSLGQASDQFSRNGDRGGASRALKLLADCACAAGDLRLARTVLREVLLIRRELVESMAESFQSVAILAARDGQAARALRFAAAATVRHEAAGTRSAPVDADEVARAVASARRALGARAADQATADGRAASVPSLIDEAIEWMGEDADAPGWASEHARAAGLTPREWEVVLLLQAGASNDAIAQHLTITKSTAIRHVANLMRKLGASSRGEAVALARGDDRAIRPA